MYSGVVRLQKAYHYCIFLSVCFFSLSLFFLNGVPSFEADPWLNEDLAICSPQCTGLSFLDQYLQCKQKLQELPDHLIVCK